MEGAWASVSVELLIIAGGILLILAAFGVGLYLFKSHFRPPTSAGTQGQAAPPPVVEPREAPPSRRA